MITPKRFLTVVAALSLIVGLAAARWFLMSNPSHFSSWLPDIWFNADNRGLTRSALNAFSSWLVLIGMLALCGRFLWPKLVPGWGCFGSVGPVQPIPSVANFPVVLVCGGILLGVLGVWLIPDLKNTYPVYRQAGSTFASLVLSESLTVILILATELFYRGGALFALEKRLGTPAVYAIAPIYTFDHIGGPLVEVVGSVFAGILLGHLALKSRTIWAGFLIHATCAVTVDVMCILAA